MRTEAPQSVSRSPRQSPLLGFSRELSPGGDLLISYYDKGFVNPRQVRSLKASSKNIPRRPTIARGRTVGSTDIR